MYEQLDTPLGSVIQEMIDGNAITQMQIDKWKHDLR